jgi:BirA family transcriptional regulator, biotin operon repressor / biotin---[acetyl-CoA-carboxylase] ligase
MPEKNTKDIIYYREIDSTNDQAKVLARQGHPSGTTLVAFKQNKGKGQKGRKWHSPPNEGLYLSMIIRPDKAPKDLPQYVRRTANVIIRTIKQKYKIPLVLEWPNDLLLENKKVGGILLEAVTQANSVSFLIFGLGLNLNQKEFPGYLKHTAISLFQKTGKRYNIESIAEAIKKALIKELKI